MMILNDNGNKQLIEYKISEIEDNLSSMKQEMTELNTKVSQLVDALIGNPLSTSDGLNEEFKRLKKKVYEHDEIVKKVKWSWWWIASIGTGIAILIQIILKIFS